MSINKEQTTTELLDDELNNKSDKLLIQSKLNKLSKSPECLKNKNSINKFHIRNSNQLDTSMTNLNKSNISVQKIIFNKKHYEQYMFQKKYLVSKTQYQKLISNLSEIDIKMKENTDLIEKLNIDLNELKETKKKKQEEVMELLSNKESLEEIVENKINSFINNGPKIFAIKNDNINGQNINVENINDIGEEQTNPNTNDSNNSNEDNKNNENDNQSHKKKESSSSSLSSDGINLLDIKFEEIKQSNQNKFQEQVVSFFEHCTQKKDQDLSMKLLKKINLSYQAFTAETNTPENDTRNSIINFFSRISLFISNQTFGNIPEKIANLFLRELLKINSIGEEIGEILKFLNKKYKDTKKELKEKIKNLNEKNESLITKKKSYESKKEELDKYLEENKEKFDNSKNKINSNDNKILCASFISDDNNSKNRRIIYRNGLGIPKNTLKIKKISFSKLNLSKNKEINLDNNENNDDNISKDVNPNTERQIVDNLNKYLFNSFQINKSKILKGNKKIYLHKTSFSRSGVNINNLMINSTEKNVESNNIINNSNNNNENIMNSTQNLLNNKRINTKIIYRNSKLKSEGGKTKSVVFTNTPNLQNLISAKKSPSKSKIILLKGIQSNSFRNLNKLKSPPKITKTHRHNHIFFQREELSMDILSKSPESNNNKRYNCRTNNIPYQNKENLNNDKKIDISRLNRNNIYSTRYDNRLKILTKGIKESFCYFKFYKENHVEYNPLDESLKTPENLNYVEGYISIDVFIHKFKIIPKIYQNKKINFEELVDVLNKEINISELNSNDLDDPLDNSFLGIELKDIIDIALTKEMKDIIKIYGAYLKYVERQEKPDINKFINSREIKDIQMEQNEKMKAVNSKYFIFSLKFKKESSPKIEFIFINYEQFNLWYDCLQYIIKINNQIPKIINTKAYIIHRSPNKKND